MITKDSVVRYELNNDVLMFTRYFFREQYNRKFIVGKHHVAIAEALGEVLRGECERLIVNVPPRYGKTELVVKNFIAMGLALNPAARFLHLSYSAALAEDNSVAVKDILQLDAYRRLYPATRIKEGADTKTKWSTTAGGGVYATSTLGQITGFGAGIVDDETSEYQFGGAVIIDDPIKPEDALSDLQRGNVNRRFETTIRNRVNSRHTPFIIIMQRLHADDLCGYLQKTESGVWKTITLPALDEQGNALWEFKHTASELQALRAINPFVFDTQYQQHPMPLEGLLYDPSAWKEYDEIPITARAVRKNYTDTADTGADDLVSIDYVETERGNYITDIVCTDAPMEQTEPMVARMLTRDNVEVANIESNNGGRGFARNVETQMRLLGNNTTRVEWFTQTANKQSRIFTNSAAVQNLTHFPRGWRTLYPKVAAQLDGFLKAGRNAHDDVADALTGTIEKRGSHAVHTYEQPPAEAESVGVVSVLDGKCAWVKASLADKCYITDAGYDTPAQDNCRWLFVGGKADVGIYNALKATITDLYAVKQMTQAEQATWRNVWAQFLWSANDARQLTFAAVAYNTEQSAETQALATLAVINVKSR